MFASTLYFVAMRIFVPAMFTCVFLVAVAFSYERFAMARKLGHTLWFAVTPPLVSMLIEGLAVFLLGIFYAVDGQWSNENSPLKGLRLWLVGELFLVSMATSVLVGLTFGDFRRSSKRLMNMNKNSFSKRHRVALLVSSAGLLGLEGIIAVLRRFPAIYQLLNAIAIIVGGLLSAWFFYEVKQFTEILKTLAMSDNGTTIRSSNDLLHRMVRHIRKWSLAAGCTLFVSLVSGLVGTFHPFFVWRVSNWGVFWCFFHTLRAFFALCKIQLSRLPRNQRDSVAMTEDMTQEQYPPQTAGSKQQRTSASGMKMTSFVTGSGPSFTTTDEKKHTSI
jgi:hypothetical protein